MSALARPPSRLPVRAWPEPKPSIPLHPTLWPSMVRPSANSGLPFPLADPNFRSFSFARYGILRVAEALRLTGREVLFPGFFHSVELEALVAAGAQVRFFPVSRRLAIDPDEVAARIGPRTAAVYVIHYGGFPTAIRELRDLCREHGLALIEDCAHALLSSADDQPLGSFGEAAVFSLPKSLPTPDGGVAVLRGGWPSAPPNREPRPAWLAAHALSLVLSNLEMRDIPAASRAHSLGVRVGKAVFRAAGHDYVPMGTPNFDVRQADTTMSGLSRRILMRQDFQGIVARRRRNYRYLLEQLADIAPPILPELGSGVCPLFYAFTTGDRPTVLRRLRAQGFEIGEFWPEHHPLGPNGEFSGVNDLRTTALWLPCHQDLTRDMLDRLALAVRCALEERSA